jgi:hypothetical protein
MRSTEIARWQLQQGGDALLGCAVGRLKQNPHS